MRHATMHATFTLMLLAAAGAHAGTADIPDEINARLARAKSQTATEIAARVRAGEASAPASGAAATQAFGTKGCNIAIGNVFEDKDRIGTSARRETTVIVTGDVIQVGNNCR